MRLTGLLGRNGVSPVLHQNVDDLPFLINGTPQVLELTVDCQIHLIQTPGISNLPSAPTQSCGILASKLVASPAHGFETNDGDVCIVAGSEISIEPMTSGKHRGY